MYIMVILIVLVALLIMSRTGTKIISVSFSISVAGTAYCAYFRLEAWAASNGQRSKKRHARALTREKKKSCCGLKLVSVRRICSSIVSQFFVSDTRYKVIDTDTRTRLDHINKLLKIYSRNELRFESDLCRCAIKPQ